MIKRVSALPPRKTWGIVPTETHSVIDRQYCSSSSPGFASSTLPLTEGPLSRTLFVCEHRSQVLLPFCLRRSCLLVRLPEASDRPLLAQAVYRSIDPGFYIQAPALYVHQAWILNLRAPALINLLEIPKTESGYRLRLLIAFTVSIDWPASSFLSSKEHPPSFITRLRVSSFVTVAIILIPFVRFRRQDQSVHDCIIRLRLDTQSPSLELEIVSL